MNALNINSSHSPTKFSRPANLTTYTILSLFNLNVELKSFESTLNSSIVSYRIVSFLA